MVWYSQPPPPIKHEQTSADQRQAVGTDPIVGSDLNNDLISKDHISLDSNKLTKHNALDNNGIQIETLFSDNGNVPSGHMVQ